MAHLKAFTPASRRLGFATYSRWDLDTRTLRVSHHETDIITLDLSRGVLTLNAGGWRSMTTLARFRELVPAAARLAEWFGFRKSVKFNSWEPWRSPSLVQVDGAVYPFADGMEINLRTGDVSGVSAARQRERVEVALDYLLKQLRAKQPDRLGLARWIVGQDDDFTIVNPVWQHALWDNENQSIWYARKIIRDARRNPHHWPCVRGLALRVWLDRKQPGTTAAKLEAAGFSHLPMSTVPAEYRAELEAA